MNNIIAVTMSANVIMNRDVNFLNFQYTKFVQDLNCFPLLIPNNINYFETLDSLPIKALLITGGSDIGLNYASHDKDLIGTVSQIRDKQESQLFHWSIDKKLPILGICRGMQLINVLLGGDLTSDLESRHPKQLNIHKRTTHDIHLRKDKLSIKVNSFHHQGITEKQLAPGLEILAHCPEDGIIEAYKHKILPIFAVQWHPERIDGLFDFFKNHACLYM